jgi:hypothetical protein
MNKIIIAILATASLAIAAEGHGAKHRWDVDGDKALTKEEWVARASHRFDVIDTNKDGKVTKEEAKAGMKHFREERKERHENRKDK